MESTTKSSLRSPLLFSLCLETVVMLVLMTFYLYLTMSSLENLVDFKFEEKLEEIEESIEALRFEVSNLSDEVDYLKGEIAALKAKEDQTMTLKVASSNPKGSLEELTYSVCKEYDNSVDPELVLIVMKHESTMNPDAYNGGAVGLMQVMPKWHSKRAKRLGITDYYDPYSNIKLGVDYLSEIHNEVSAVRGADKADWRLCLMIYKQGYAGANRDWDRGKISSYASDIWSEYLENSQVA